ncbi:hypothetical protein VNO80_06899 [Phaseolus coccineus]|uniref:Transmembrane protein n=1 Tax=Phaseolus coccineus TaxID=3886 RepID=A0AAN9RJ45_PHACN
MYLTKSASEAFLKTSFFVFVTTLSLTTLSLLFSLFPNRSFPSSIHRSQIHTPLPRTIHRIITTQREKGKHKETLIAHSSGEIEEENFYLFLSFFVFL